MEDVVTAKASYGRPDQPGSAVRIRLNSAVVHAQHDGPADAAKSVQVTYMRGGKLHSIQGHNCVLACYNGMIPYLCPELPEKQKEALSYLVKAPLVYTHVALRNWTSFAKLNVRHIVAPGAYHTFATLDFPVSLGEYKFPSKPEEPMVLFLLRTPCKPGLPARDQHRAGRAELLQTPFSPFERNIRDQLARMLGGGDCDPARDIEGITVNRWAHGYAYESGLTTRSLTRSGRKESNPGCLGENASERSRSPILMRGLARKRIPPSIRLGAPSAKSCTASGSSRCNLTRPGNPG